MRYLLVILFFWSGILFAQECEDVVDAKQQKLIEKAENRKKYDVKERIKFLQEAIEEGEECLSCRLMLGQLLYKRARVNPGTSFSLAQSEFQAVYDRCPQFHADVSYYLGIIHFAQQEWSESLEAFDTFLEFPVDDPSKLPKDWSRKVQDVNGILSEVEFNAEFFDKPVPFDPKKVENVSGPSDEYLPMISPDNEHIYYTRKYIRKAKGDLYGRQVEEFTISSRPTIDAAFDGGERLAPPFNQGDNYGGATISVDNREMFVTVCRPDASGYNNCDIYSSRLDKVYDESQGKEVWQWSELENLGSNVNTREGWESQPSLSADGKTLYFATVRGSTMTTTTGDPSTDIFMTSRSEDGSWGRAVPVGDGLNTAGNDKSPFMHGDSRTLYFSSDGRTGAGGYDIYFSRLKDDGSWTEPKNIGIPINTPEDEHGLIVSTDGKWAYYASSKLAGSKGFDIYRFELPEAAKPEKVVLVRGTVKDEDGEPQQEARIQLNYVESKRVESVELDTRDGSYATIVNVEREPVVMTIEEENKAFNAELITEEDAETLIKEVEVELKDEKLGEPYTINDIYYETNSAQIDEDSKAVLIVFSQYLSERSDIKVAIHGHTDDVGGKESNLTLSTERAFEVMRFLQDQGVPSGRLSYKGFGPNKPVASNATETGRAKNRRTEFIITAR